MQTVMKASFIAVLVVSHWTQNVCLLVEAVLEICVSRGVCHFNSLICSRLQHSISTPLANSCFAAPVYPRFRLQNVPFWIAKNQPQKQSQPQMEFRKTHFVASAPWGFCCRTSFFQRRMEGRKRECFLMVFDLRMFVKIFLIGKTWSWELLKIEGWGLQRGVCVSFGMFEALVRLRREVLKLFAIAFEGRMWEPVSRCLGCIS